MERVKAMLFLHDLELELQKQMQKFELDVRNRWARLPALEVNTIYHICPYFDDIDNYFQKGIMRIVDHACRQYHSFTGQTKELSWYAVCNDYPDVIEELCAPYIDAFEAVASKGMDRLRSTRAKLENASSRHTYGYITNSFGFALAYETFNAISEALKSVENDNLAWQSATEPQRIIHNKLSALWTKSYNDVFVARVCTENRAVIATIIEDFSLSLGFTYEKYLEEKASPEFANVLQIHQKVQNEQKMQKELSKQQKKKLCIEQIYQEINAINTELSGMGFAFWGEKGARKKALQKKMDSLQAEIRAIEHPLPLPSTYVAYVSHNASLYNIFRKNLDKWHNNSQERWRFEYSEKHNDYVAYTPQNEPLFKLGQGFLQKYGRHRQIQAKFEGCSSDDYQSQVAEMEYSIFEIK